MTEQIAVWLQHLQTKLFEAFGQERILFFGLQGSCRRGEEKVGSDIDTVVILDCLAMKDLIVYREILDRMPMRERTCGFIAGKCELAQWEQSELFQFYHDTEPIYGSLDGLIPQHGSEEIRRAIKIGACTIYHACVHHFLHGGDAQMLSELYKSAFFLLQAKEYDRTNRYFGSKKALLSAVEGADREILSLCIEKDRLLEIPVDHLTAYYDKILVWSSKLICSYES